MTGQSVQVAISPFGCVLTRAVYGRAARVTFSSNADAVVEDENADHFFVEPCEAVEDFGEFLTYVQTDSASSEDARDGRNVKYAQTRNTMSSPLSTRVC